MSKKLIYLLLGISALLIIVFKDKISLLFDSRQKTINSKTVFFYISKPVDLSTLATELEAKGIIDDKEALKNIGEYKNLNIENIALGKYAVESGTNYKTLLNGFRKNNLGNGNAEVEVMVQVPGVANLSMMIGKVSKQLNIDSTTFINALYADSTLRKYGFTKEQLPGLFFANNYAMFWDTSIDQFLGRMAKEYKNFWNDERKALLKKSRFKSQSEVTTLASIVYSEQSFHPEEWPVIARLYMNRLDQGIKLQSDPTFKFCWGEELKGVQRLLKIHRDANCPYNTYKIKGLPPGPISMVPSKVIDAVLNPDDNNYIYMCARPDNSFKHYFTNDYAVHQKNAAAYHKFMDER